ncbi:MAG: restriction endonuclease subunit S [Verrucomicrobia bacterium]|nr:restriction endonuclease subunit S [Verrucomicrobiota bacterium]
MDFADVEQRYFTVAKAAQLQPVKGDILIERSGGGPTQPVGRIGIVESDLPGHGFSNFVQLLRPNMDEIVPDFLAWSLFRLHQSGIVERLQHQTTQMRNLDYRDYLRALIPRPPKPEQEVIAKAIRLVSDTVKLGGQKLTAAQRLKTALMQQLFTRGIPGRHTKFKQTKIGEIPKEWEVLRIQQVLDGPPFNGVSPQSRDEPPGTPILNVSCIYDGKCDPAHVSYVDVDAATFAECRAHKGDFYVLRGNGNRNYVATGGYLAVEPEPPCIFSDKLIRIRFKPDMIAESFIPMMWQTSAFLRRFQSKAESGSGLWMMSKRDIRREFFARPKLDEQEEIVSLVTAADDNIAGVEREIEALRKLKTSLLQNLLTGKVRVKMET